MNSMDHKIVSSFIPVTPHQLTYTQIMHFNYTKYTERNNRPPSVNQIALVHNVTKPGINVTLKTPRTLGGKPQVCE